MFQAHKYRAYKPKLASLRKVNKLLADEVDSDINNVQWMLTSKKQFRVVYDLLEGKYINGDYSGEEKDLLSIFFKYHRQQWGPDSHVCFWWEGANPYHVSNNQGIESKNGEIKDIYSFRERLNMGSFFEMVENILRDESRRDDTLLNDFRVNYTRKDSDGNKRQDSFRIRCLVTSIISKI